MIPPKLSCSYISAWDQFQDSLQIPKSADAQFPHVKWFRSVHTYSWPLIFMDLLTTDRKQYGYLWEKKSTCGWTRTLQTCIVQGSTVHAMEYYRAIKTNELLIPTTWTSLKILLKERSWKQECTYSRLCTVWVMLEFPR